MWSTLEPFSLLPHKWPSLCLWKWRLMLFPGDRRLMYLDLLQQLSRFCCTSKNCAVRDIEKTSMQSVLKQRLCQYKLCQCFLCHGAWKWCGCLNSYIATIMQSWKNPNPRSPMYHEIGKFPVTGHFSEGFWQITRTTLLQQSYPVFCSSRDLDTAFLLVFLGEFLILSALPMYKPTGIHPEKATDTYYHLKFCSNSGSPLHGLNKDYLSVLKYGKIWILI